MAGACIMKLAWSFILVAAGAPAHAALTVSNVQPSKMQVANGEAVDVRFRLEDPARVTLNIYDGRDLLIRRVTSPRELASGDNALTWDGNDEAGRVVPAEAYTYTLVAQRGGKSVTWDVADATGGADLLAREIKWDKDAKKIRYIIDAPARVNIRIGFVNNGPLLRTVIDWVVRPPGVNEESWDGWDASKVLALAEHPQLHIAVNAFRLPENTILVGEPPPTVTTIDASGWKKETRVAQQASSPKRMYAHAQQPLEARGDFSVRLELPGDLQKTSDGVPIVTRQTPVRLTIPDSDRARALARRFEPVFFLDGQFVFENEVGFVPMTWNWDPQAVNPGEHYLTVNLRGYEGNFGMATIKVAVQKE
jgi:hypothetical protein